MSKGPYKPGPVPQWLLEEQAKVYAQSNYMQPGLLRDSTPDVYIMGRRYNGNTGEMIK